MENNQGRLKKLVLHKETVRKLTIDELGMAVGGLPPRGCLTDYCTKNYNTASCQQGCDTKNTL